MPPPIDLLKATFSEASQLRSVIAAADALTEGHGGTSGGTSGYGYGYEYECGRLLWWITGAGLTFGLRLGLSDCSWVRLSWSDVKADPLLLLLLR